MLQARLFFLATAFLAITLTARVQSNSTVQRITNTPEQSINLNPIISDDGSTIAFESTTDLANTGGSTTFRGFRGVVQGHSASISELGKTRVMTPSLTRDGSRIAFASTEDLVGENPDRNSEIFLADVTNISQLTHTQPDSETSRLADGNWQPSISADGSSIAFLSNRNLAGDNTNRNRELILLDLVSNRQTQLTAASEGLLSDPKISGDGTRVFFVSRTVEGAGDLLMFDRTTGNLTTLEREIPELALTAGRAISTNGKRIVYSATYTPNQSQVFLFDLQESASRQLTQLGSRVTDVALAPTISGDGKRVAFATRRRVLLSGDGSVELFVLDLPTGQIQQVTNAPANATAEVTASLNHDGSIVCFSFPRVLSGPVTEDDLANNGEIYLATTTPRPSFGTATVQNAAAKGNEPGPSNQVAIGSIVSMHGTALAFKSSYANEVLPSSLAGTLIEVNGNSARIFYASPDEVIFLLPSGIVAGKVEVVATNSEGFKSTAEAIVSNTAPGIFTETGNGRGQGVILNAVTLTHGPFDPTDDQLRLSVFVTGVANATKVTANLGGVEAPVEAVHTSSLPGLEEVHIQVSKQQRGFGLTNLVISADGVASNSVNLELSGSSLRDVVINEFLADPPDGLAGDANHDGVRDSSGDEFIELVNSTKRDIDLSGYQLQTRSLTSSNDTLRHRFAQKTILSAGTAIVVFGGGNPDGASTIFGGSQIVKASTGSLSLTNAGGAITLRDVLGQIVTSVTYGSSPATPSDNNQSVTRSPDITGNFALHSQAATSLFSPGVLIDQNHFQPNPPVSAVLLTPTLASLVPGAQIQFSARAVDQNQQEVTDVIFNWTTTSPSVVEVDANGRATAKTAGTAEVTASARNVKSAPTMVTVSTPTPSPTPTPTPSPSPSPSPVPTPTPNPIPNVQIVISEFRTRGPNGANDEFVELYNNSDATIDISGWKIRGSSNGATVTTRLTVAAGTVVPARGHFLAAASTYSGSVSADQSYSSGISNDGGIAVTRPDDNVVDQVGLSSGSAFREGTQIAPLSADINQSYERRPGGSAGSTQDSQNNSDDFQLVSPSEPQNTHSTPTPGSSPTPTPTPTPQPSPTPTPSPSPTPNTAKVVISQIYGGGGNAGAPFRNDFVELFNNGSIPVDLTGWSIQYASSTASTWSVTTLSSVVLAPGQYYLIQEISGGTNGALLPTTDVAGSIAMAATAGKLALVKSATALTGSCPSNINIVDFVGYGAAANCFLGNAPALAPSNTNALLRNSTGCLNSRNNQTDFTVSAPSPKNTMSPTHSCDAQTSVTRNSSLSVVAQCDWSAMLKTVYLIRASTFP